MEIEPIATTGMIQGILNVLKQGVEVVKRDLEPVMMTPKEIQEQKMKEQRGQHVQPELPEDLS